MVKQEIFIGGKKYYQVDDMLFTQKEILQAKQRYQQKKLQSRVQRAV